MGFFERQFEQDAYGEKKKEGERVARHSPVLDSWARLVVYNALFALTLLPGLISLYLFFTLDAIVFLPLAAGLFAFAGPSFCAVYDTCYHAVRDADSGQKRNFFESYRLNFKQGACAMLLICALGIPLMAALLLRPFAGSQDGETFITVYIYFYLFLLTWFGVNTFSQIALVPLPLKQILKNALLLIPLTKGRGLLSAVLHTVFIALVYKYPTWGLLFVIVIVPAQLMMQSARLLWPALSKILICQKDEKTQSGGE